MTAVEERPEVDAGAAPDPAAGSDPVDGVDGGGFAPWWAARTRGQQAVLLVVALVAVLGIAGSALGGIVGGTPGGPISSSFSTGAGGLQGWSELLARRDHPVTRLRTDLAEADLDPSATVVVADPEQLDEADAAALARFVAAGGRAVVAGAASGPLLGALVGAPVGIEAGGRQLATWLPVPETAGVAEVAGGRGGAWSTPAPLVGVVGDARGRAAVAVATVGRGRVVAVADADLFHNRNLGRADNAALALAVVGPTGRPVVFAEAVHGFGASGWAAVPGRWKTAGLVALVALVAGLWGAGTRFGGPEPDRRSLRPPRRDHVDAVAAALAVGGGGRADPPDPPAEPAVVPAADPSAPRTPGAAP